MGRDYDRESNTLMLVASIIATVTFQAMVNPPRSLKGGFKTFNTLSFSASMAIILLLISGIPLKRKSLIWPLRIIMWIAVMSTAATYFVVMVHVVDEDTGIKPPPPPPSGPGVQTVPPPPDWIPPEKHSEPTSYPYLMGFSLIIILTLGFAIGIFFRILRCWKQKRLEANSNTRDQSPV